MVAEHSYCKIGKSPEFESLLCSSEAAGFTAHSKNTQNKIFWRSCVSRYNLRSQKKDFYRKRRQSSSLLFPCRATYFAPERLEEWDEFILFSYNSGPIHPFCKIVGEGKEFIRFCPPNSMRQPLSSLLYKSFFYALNNHKRCHVNSLTWPKSLQIKFSISVILENCNCSMDIQSIR